VKTTPPALAGVVFTSYWTTEHDWQKKPLSFGDRFVGFRLAGRPEAWVLEHVAYDREGVLVAAVRLAPVATSWGPFLSPDGRHFFVAQTADGAKYDPKKVDRMTVFATATAARVGGYPYRHDTKEPQRIGPRAYCVHEGPLLPERTRTLRAYDLATGELLWQRRIWIRPLVPLPC
jgi:hypothetical protein